MPLEECASVIGLQMEKNNLNIYDEIAGIIYKDVKATSLVEPISDFALKHNSLKFITTNYDMLIEQDVLKGSYTGYCPGYPVNRQRQGNEVYHVHGAIKYPRKMVVTANDYYKFINKPNYFSRKLNTLIDENTTVIIGYSLGDINFKSILNSRREVDEQEINRQHLFFISRGKVPQHVKDYYDSSYGLRVIENTSIESLIEGIESKYDEISDRVHKAKSKLTSVLSGDKKYTDTFLKEKESFQEILATIASTGTKINHPNVIKFLRNTLERKVSFTHETGAWVQYDHLAEWLIQLGCIMDLKGTGLEETYLDAVVQSFRSMSKNKTYGYAWDAYKSWENGWGSITYKNRVLIRAHTKTAVDIGDGEHIINLD